MSWCVWPLRSHQQASSDSQLPSLSSCLAPHSCLAALFASLLLCRGIARFPEGVPAELQAACIRQVWGPGARAGTYQISGGRGLELV